MNDKNIRVAIITLLIYLPFAPFVQYFMCDLTWKLFHAWGILQ